MLRWIVGLVLPMCLLPRHAPGGTPDLILHHGRVVTVDKQFSIQQAIAIEGNRIVQVGADEAILKLQGKQTRLIDLNGKMVLPGLIDSHTHPLSAAMTEFDHAIPDMGSIEDVLNYFRQRAQVVPAGELKAAARKMAAKVAEASGLVVAIGKQAFYTQIDLDQSKAYAYAKEVMSMNALAADAQEGISAFLGKRKPCWSGK